VGLEREKDCGCIEAANKALEPHGTQLNVMYSFSGGQTAAIVASEKLPNARRGTKPKTVIATFCPFCGVKYATKKDDLSIIS
jgi:hypothetical protein